MGRRHVAMLVLLAAIWGSSFMFIKVADRGLHPETLVFGRLVFAVATLAVIMVLGGRVRETGRALCTNLGPLLLAAILNVAIPFWLLAWGETRVDSGSAALLQASAPIFTAVFALFFVHSERVSGLRLFGVLLGFGGVALLVGATPGGSVLGALACVATGGFYACAALYTGRRLRHVPPLMISFWMTALAAILWAPAGLARLPGSWPGWKVVGSVVALGVPALGIAYVLYFALITQAGAVRAMLVTYLVPPLALAYGALILGESIDASDVFGALLILVGVALGAGRLRARRAPAPT